MDIKDIDPPRVVTDREIFDREFLTVHSACMDMACKEAKVHSDSHKIPIECFDISALTYQLFRLWVDNAGFIERLKNEKQAELDKRFKQK